MGLSGAYTNNDLGANTGTTLFDIDTSLNQVVIQRTQCWPLVPTDGPLCRQPGGFDIYTELQNNVAINNSDFASLLWRRAFYRVNFLTGQAFPPITLGIR
jgi:hypothetical protein